MPSTVEQLNPSRVKLTVEIPFSDLQPHLTKAYREIAQSVTIPGFRKGKVPSAVIDQRFGRGVVGLSKHAEQVSARKRAGHAIW